METNHVAASGLLDSSNVDWVQWLRDVSAVDARDSA